MLQTSPNGKAIAFVDREIFDNVFSWLESDETDPNTSFDCLIEYFTTLLSNDVDIVFLVMDLSREDFLERSRRKVISNFTVAQRIFESGIGTLRQPLLAPVGPPAMRSYSFLGVREGLLSGPFLHEIAHGWCAYLDGPLSLAAQLDQDPISHWGFTSVGGVLGGWDADSLEYLGEQHYQALAPTPFEAFAPQGYANNNIPFAPLELYLMGLLPPEEVPDIQVAINPAFINTSGPETAFSADALETVTIADIVTANGQRLPDATDAQKHFNVALIVLAEESLNDVQWGFYEEAMDCLESTTPCIGKVLGVSTNGSLAEFEPLNFFEATGGRASIRFAPLKELDPLPTEVVSLTNRAVLCSP